MCVNIVKYNHGRMLSTQVTMMVSPVIMVTLMMKVIVLNFMRELRRVIHLRMRSVVLFM